MSSQTVASKLAAAVPCLIALSTVLCYTGCEEKPISVIPTVPTPFIIVVVGSGVPSNAVSVGRSYPLNRAQGKAMWDGAMVAFSSPELLGLSEFVTIVGLDDGDREDRSAALAAEIRDTPKVIGVIGHATSSTTRSAAHIYHEAGIPLLMPIATSPSACTVPGNSRSGERLNNCFRLPPCDVPVQAAALASFVDRLSGEKVFLIRDVSEGAAEYSGPLFERLRELLSTKPYFRPASVGFAESVYYELAVDIQGEKSEVVVFCGYGSNANVFVNHLRRVYSGGGDRPKLVFSDGCRIPDLDTSGFEAYLSFPLPPLETLRSDSPSYLRLKEIVADAGDFSYQLYGFDAAVIMGSAVLSCRDSGPISRFEVMKHLRAAQFRSCILEYSFVNGENSLVEYCIYSLRFDTSTRRTEYKLESRLDRRDLAKYAREKKGV